jgi:hypothetical protein
LLLNGGTEFRNCLILCIFQYLLGIRLHCPLAISGTEQINYRVQSCKVTLSAFSPIDARIDGFDINKSIMQIVVPNKIQHRLSLL